MRAADAVGYWHTLVQTAGWMRSCSSRAPRKTTAAGQRRTRCSRLRWHECMSRGPRPGRVEIDCLLQLGDRVLVTAGHFDEYRTGEEVVRGARQPEFPADLWAVSAGEFSRDLGVALVLSSAWSRRS